MIPEILNNILTPAEEYTFGLADLTGLTGKKFGAFRYGISIGKKLDDRIMDAVVNGPTREYLHHYNEINSQLQEVAARIQAELKKAGIDSMAFEPSTPVRYKQRPEYLSTLTVDLSHKMVATRAGLGWIGKTGLLVSLKFGPRLRLVSLLINKKPVINATPINRSRCGKCSVCVQKCPAQAANGRLWDTKTPRDRFYDAQKCRKRCNELSKEILKVDQRICGVCVAVCPVGKRNRKHPKHGKKSSPTLTNFR